MPGGQGLQEEPSTKFPGPQSGTSTTQTALPGVATWPGPQAVQLSALMFTDTVLAGQISQTRLLVAETSEIIR